MFEAVFVLAGVLFGCCDWLGSVRLLPRDALLGGLIADVATGAIFGALAGLVLGGAEASGRIANRRTWFRVLTELAVILAPFPWYGLRYGATAAAFFVLLTALRQSIAVRLTTLVLVLLLFPLFSGQAMVLVFSEWQTFLVFGAALLVLWWTTTLMLGRDGGPTGRIAAALLLGTLTWATSVFAVRLWGFNTMEYLQVIVAFLQVGLAARVVAPLARTIGTTGRRVSAVLFGLFAVIVFAAGAAGSLPRGVSTAFVRGSPHLSLVTSFALGTLDRDGDGSGRFMGLGDCNDADPSIHPGATDLPGNGIDENCFAGDLQSIAHPYFNVSLDGARFEPSPGQRPRAVILLTVDTLRADRTRYDELGFLADRASRMTRAYSQSNNTLESFPYLFHPGFRIFPRYNPRWVLLEQIKKAGIPSLAILQSSMRSWWGDGLDEVFLAFDRTLKPDSSVRMWSSSVHAETTLREMREHPPGTFFLFTHFEALHDYPAQVMEGGRMIVQGVNLSEVFELFRFESLAARLSERYDAVAVEVFDAVKRIADGIPELEKTHDVTFIMTSDHGEELGEHGGLFHMGTLYQEVVRVPLLVYRTNRERTDTALNRGVYQVGPTVLDGLGIRSPFIERFSLLRDDPEDSPIFGTFSLTERSERRSYMVVRGSRKLVLDSAVGVAELFDLETDPHERDGRIARLIDPEAAALMRELDTVMFYLSFGDERILEIRRRSGE